MVGLSRVWHGWRGPLRYVQADTVVRWARERFRRFWARLSGTNRRGRGRPGTGVEIRRLIGRMASENPLWRTPRLHGELQMLGIQISFEAFADREVPGYLIRDRDCIYGNDVRLRILCE